MRRQHATKSSSTWSQRGPPPTDQLYAALETKGAHLCTNPFCFTLQSLPTLLHSVNIAVPNMQSTTGPHHGAALHIESHHRFPSFQSMHSLSQKYSVLTAFFVISHHRLTARSLSLNPLIYRWNGGAAISVLLLFSSTNCRPSSTPNVVADPLLLSLHRFGHFHRGKSPRTAPI